MSLNPTLLAPVAKYVQYDGTNGAEIAEYFGFPYDEESRSICTVTVDSEEDGVLVLSWDAGWRNFANTEWEIHNAGSATVRTGDYLRDLRDANGITVMPASQIGVSVVVVANPNGE